MHAAGHAVLALAAGMCVRAALGAASPLDEGSTSWAFVGPPQDRAVFAAIVGLGAALLKSAGGVCAVYAQARIAGNVASRLRLDVLDRWLTRHRLRRPWHADQGVRDRDADGAVAVGDGARGVAALTLRVRDVEWGLSTGVLGGARAVTQLVPLVAVLVVVSPRLAACALFVLAPFALALGAARRAWKRANAEVARHNDALLEAADEAVRHADLWTTYGAEAKARGHVAALGHSMARGAARVDASAAALSGANEVLGALALLAALGAARAGWLGAGLGGGTLLAFAVAFFLAYRPVRELTEARLALARTRAAMEEIEVAVAGSRLEAAESESRSGAAWPLAALEICDVPVGRGVVLSARIGPGEIVAVCGATGAGKTTLLRALLGLDALVGGEVRYDGRALDGGPGPASRPFAWVPQDAPLLAATLEENVCLAEGAADATAALAAIGAERLTRELSGARLGAGGRAVSGGERQWIGLARAVATQQPVLLLDEPTSGLDAAAQARVLEAIARLRGSRTVVLVTHRTEPLAICDQTLHLPPVAPSVAPPVAPPVAPAVTG